jgi:hypothetical protein
MIKLSTRLDDVVAFLSEHGAIDEDLRTVEEVRELVRELESAAPALERLAYMATGAA